MKSEVQKDPQSCSPQAAPIPRCYRAPICGGVAIVLREEREARGLSIYELAKRSKVSRQMVSYVEREDAGPSVDMVARIGEGLERPLLELIAKALWRCELAQDKASNILD